MTKKDKETASTFQPTPVEGGWSFGAKYFSALVLCPDSEFEQQAEAPTFPCCTELMHKQNHPHLSLRVGSESTTKKLPASLCRQLH